MRAGGGGWDYPSRCGRPQDPHSCGARSAPRLRHNVRHRLLAKPLVLLLQPREARLRGAAHGALVALRSTRDVRRLVCVAGSVSLTALVLLLHGSGVRPGAALVTSGGPAVHDVAAQRREMQGHEMRGRDVVSCFERLSMADEPWFAVYGDSLTRGVFFDVATLLNSSSTGVGSDVVHPGHGANYSDDCTIFETRPPLRRLKCGGFEYAAPLTQDDLHRTGRVVTPERLAGAGLGRMRQLRMTYRLKTFTWEEEFDTPWLESLRHAPRLPDVLLLGFGVWDMQYPPDGDVVAGIEVLLLRALQTRTVRESQRYCRLHARRHSIARCTASSRRWSGRCKTWLRGTRQPAASPTRPCPALGLRRT